MLIAYVLARGMTYPTSLNEHLVKWLGYYLGQNKLGL